MIPEKTMKAGGSSVAGIDTLDNSAPHRLDERMDAGTAGKLIENALARMRSAYLSPVFDEWAIVSPQGVLAYAGPRPGNFAKELAADIMPLRTGLGGQELHVGDIDFSPQAEGRSHDAVVKLGQAAYLLLNHTGKTMEEIRLNSRWLEAQPFLFALCERFRADPLAA
jgi:hypothetical protein